MSSKERDGHRWCTILCYTIAEHTCGFNHKTRCWEIVFFSLFSITILGTTCYLSFVERDLFSFWGGKIDCRTLLSKNQVRFVLCEREREREREGVCVCVRVRVAQ